MKHSQYGLLAGCLSLTLSSRAGGQIMPERAEIAVTIAAAEAEGAVFPRLRKPPVVARPAPSGVLFDSAGVPSVPNNVLYGAAFERRCVEGRGMGPAQSGEFIIGGELGTAPPVPSGWPRKIWWAPLHPSRSLKLVVRAQLLGSPGDTLRYTSSDWAKSIPEGKEFYPSGFVALPRPGRWLVVATSGPDWGCFILTRP